MASVTMATARSKASALCGAGVRNPETLRTYWSAAARMSSSVTASVNGGRNVLMLLHMTQFSTIARRNVLEVGIGCASLDSDP